MSGVITRKSNFAEIDSFDDFQPRNAVQPAQTTVNKPVSEQAQTTATKEINSIEAEHDSSDYLEPEQIIEPNPHQLANSRKEKADLQRLARQSGYNINNLVEKPIPARLEPESNTFLKTVRIEVSDWNRFQRWCHANSYTHKKGFKVLTQKLPVK